MPPVGAAAASAPYTLTAMTIMALVLLPVALLRRASTEG